ncbi:MAG: 2-hydroxyglutaryl-CoA dehydratase [Candidatus Lokiarchaeota archaeon]|nr:2-hydroxyglutaryl-CoA dehydratase [Candidatus Lokiarchaeota archaeon]
MYFAGCDVGSLTAEAVIMEDNEILGYEIIRVRPRPEQSATDVMNKTLQKLDLEMANIDYCVSTGYGRERIPFAKKNISEISCHGKGAQWLIPSIRTVIDVGGQDCKVINVDENGKVLNFIMNEKCAAGTGRFLEIMARTLGVTIDELGPISLKSNNPVVITSQCSVFTEFETRVLLNEGKKIEDIAAGINKAMARRVYSLANRLNIVEDLGITGGVAKNVAVVKNLEEITGIQSKDFPEDPQIMGALGAALYARNKYLKQKDR